MVLLEFRWTCRYVDDICGIGNFVLGFHLYTNSYFFGIQGIYPPFLRLSQSAAGRQTPFLDILPYYLPNGAINTTLYNKLREQKFAHIRICRFPHISSNLSRRCKYNCLVGEFHRLRRIILDQDNFCFEVARVMYELTLRGYSISKLQRTLHGLLASNRNLYSGVPDDLGRSIYTHHHTIRQRGLLPYPPNPPPLQIRLPGPVVP